MLRTDDLGGSVAIVTGAARGIGRQYAMALATEGVRLVVTDVLETEGEETVKLIENEGGEAAFCKADVTDEASVTSLVAFTLDRYGEIAILVNNAGLYGGLPMTPLGDATAERWRRVMDVNVASVFLMSKAVAPHMGARGAGVIVNQSSIGAYLAYGAYADYCTSKGAVIVLTKALANELGPMNVRVNAIAPGTIHTEATLEKTPPDDPEIWLNLQTIKRKGMPEDLVGPLLFLCSDASSFMTGQVLVVDGGQVMPA